MMMMTFGMLSITNPISHHRMHRNLHWHTNSVSVLVTPFVGELPVVAVVLHLPLDDDDVAVEEAEEEEQPTKGM